jgi:hypothetical protein
VPDRHRQAHSLDDGRRTVREARVGASSRGVQRLRALVMCLSFALSLPATAASRWEPGWPARAVVTLMSAAVGVAALPRARAALAAQSARPRQVAAVPVAPWASPGSVRAPARWQEQQAPGFDGRRLYLEQCSLSC